MENDDSILTEIIERLPALEAELAKDNEKRYIREVMLQLCKEEGIDPIYIGGCI